MLKSGVWYMQMRNVTGLLQSSDTWVSVATFIYNPSCANALGSESITEILERKNRSTEQ